MRLLLNCTSILLATSALCQTPNHDTLREPVDIRFLFHYYEQDGNHSPVTGGIGGEKLEDRSARIVINVPIDSTGKLKVNGGWNFYTSASTDRISSISSASSEDNRVEADITYIRTKRKRRPVGFTIGGSSETDYMSSSLGIIWGRESSNLNRNLDVLLRVWFDKWMIVLPDELRDDGWNSFPTDKRRTLLLGVEYKHEFSQRGLIAANLDPQYQWGLLGTPFHRFILSDSTAITEVLPNSKWRFPLGLRMNYNFGGVLISRIHARFYADNFGIRSLALTADPVLRISKLLRVTPAYRFYMQSASKYFFPYLSLDAAPAFRTSDYDLSRFTSQRLSLTLGVEPVRGLMRLSKDFWLSGITAGYYRYWRSDGLQAWWVSGEMRFLVW